ncbi:MAG: hypothetical protein K9N29_05365 [Candidatus Marinimicrobia bacterium]|nr:hypothetical protein [Candidatus Neomarinimicrobiota bacterium]
MQVLLTHALKSEAGFIKQRYPLAETVTRENGQELIQLDSNLHLLKTGIGLKLSQAAMHQLENPDKFDLIVHFGVSGSLSDDLSILQVVRGTIFSRPDFPNLNIPSPRIFEYLPISSVSFFSSLVAITDEKTRESARVGGAEAVDMESYSIAQFCQERDIPLLAIRCISDRAGSSTSEDFKKHYGEAAQILQKFLLNNILNKCH